jgi:hypothetical protein
MATVYTDNYTRLNADKRGLPGFTPQAKHSILEEYEADALEAASTIYMFMPPKGWRYAGSGQLSWDDLGTSNTLSVGIPGAVEKFLAATAADAAADKIELDAGATAVDALGYEFDGATPVIVTGAGGAHTGTIKLRMDFLPPL